MVSGISNVALLNDSTDSILSSKYSDSEKAVKEEIDLPFFILDENITFKSLLIKNRRLEKI